MRKSEKYLISDWKLWITNGNSGSIWYGWIWLFGPSKNIVRYKLLIGSTQWAVNLLQISLLFILFAHNLENSIEYFLIQSKIRHSPTTITNSFVWMCELPINYFHILWNYYQTNKDGGVLGCPICYSQREILLINIKWDSLCKYFPAVYSHS